MVALIAVLVVGVVYLAYKSPSPTEADNAQNPGPNVNVPALGNVGNPSPAMSGGTPVASQLWRTAMSVNAGIVGNLKALRANPTSFNGLSAMPGALRPPTQTVSEMSKSLMTQAPPPIANVGTNANGVIGSKFVKI